MVVDVALEIICKEKALKCPFVFKPYGSKSLFKWAELPIDVLERAGKSDGEQDEKAHRGGRTYCGRNQTFPCKATKNFLISLPYLGRSRTSTGTRSELMVGYIEAGGAGTSLDKGGI